jgi:hypothetical protein
MTLNIGIVARKDDVHIAKALEIPIMIRYPSARILFIPYESYPLIIESDYSCIISVGGPNYNHYTKILRGKFQYILAKDYTLDQKDIHVSRCDKFIMIFGWGETESGEKAMKYFLSTCIDDALKAILPTSKQKDGILHYYFDTDLNLIIWKEIKLDALTIPLIDLSILTSIVTKIITEELKEYTLHRSKFGSMKIIRGDQSLIFQGISNSYELQNTEYQQLLGYLYDCKVNQIIPNPKADDLHPDYPPYSGKHTTIDWENFSL